MTTPGNDRVVITGIGIVTPLGNSPGEVLRSVRAGVSAAIPFMPPDESGFDCPVCARCKQFDPRRFVAEPKMIRLMSRDAQLAVAAARLALQDAGVNPRATYPADEIGLFGATGLAGLPLHEVAPLIRLSADPIGGFDLGRFGQVGLKAVSPILSFKILSNMPLCFVSINEGIQGPNAIFTPWEGEGAQALEAGVRALEARDARCALVGGCDVKTHELAFASLQQQGVFSSWAKTGKGLVPGEGAAFLVLETEREARARNARVYGAIRAASLRPRRRGEDPGRTRMEVLRRLEVREAEDLVSCATDDWGQDAVESDVLKAADISVRNRICPKRGLGDLFAAAALVQVALAATLTHGGARSVLAHCFGHDSTQAAFVLEAT